MRLAASIATLPSMNEPSSQVLPVVAIALLGAFVYGLFAVLAIVLG